ncbi:40S ribosomal protein S8-like [Nannospalax galili]|uniref:40S ribosomal protein S8-like n=1 Tax=Nannospalax galili TaxID=1026970 RepID=UPI0004ED0ADF|nr:40S ribosomal protein S8-like [Nannospalax galili]
MLSGVVPRELAKSLVKGIVGEFMDHGRIKAQCFLLPSIRSLGCTRKTRIIDVVYNASNNELIRTKTLVKNCIVFIDSTPYRQWYKSHYALPLGRKKGAKLTPEEEEILNKKRSKKKKNSKEIR